MSDGEPEIAPPCVYDVMATIPDPCLDPRQSLLKSSDLSEVNRLIDQLPHRWAKVIRLRYGIDGDGPHAMRIVGQRISRSRSSVQQIERKSLRKLTLQFRRVNEPLVCPDRNRQHF